MQSRNLAARAGRWSAQHRKTAILGWILFVVLATVLGGKVGQNDLDESARGQRRVQARRHDRQGRRLPRPGRRAGARAGQGLVRPAILRSPPPCKDVVGRLAADRGRHRDREPARPAHRVNTVSKDGRSVVVNFTMPGTDEHVEQLVDQAARRRGRRRRPPTPACASSSSATPRPPRRSPPRTRKDGKKVAGHLLRPDADHPAGRVRRARRRRRPARARRHRRRRHGRPARAGQPALRAPARRRRARGDHRPRRRRGLRDVLLAPHDGGARPRPLGRGRGGDRRRHLGPRGAHLGPDRDDRDGRAAVRRQPDLRRLRHRHDARRRRRRARLDDLPARDALVPRREELAREGPRALRHQAPPPGQGRVARLGRHPHPRPQAPARVGAARRRPARRPLRPRARHPVQGARLRRLLAQPAGHPDLRPAPGRLPRRRRPGHDRDQGRGRHGRAGPGRDPRSCTTRRWPPASSPSPRTSRSAPTRPSPSSPSRSRAAAPTPPPSARSRSCAPRSSPPPSASCPAPRSP